MKGIIADILFWLGDKMAPHCRTVWLARIYVQLMIWSDKLKPWPEECGCICQNCGRGFKMDRLVPDNIWERIKPAGKAKGAGLLCPSCIVVAVEKLLGYSYFWLRP